MATEQDLAALKRQRATIKASCTRIRTYVESVVAVTPTVAAQLEERRLRLNEYWSSYNEIQINIEAHDEAEANDRAGFEDAFYALSAKIREALNPVFPSRSTAVQSPSTSRASDQTDGQFHVRLPKLNLPTFSGKYDEWFPFFDSFNSIIHSNMSINNTQKLQYLRTSLTGDASNIISFLEISELNYDVAWNLLKERYDNKRVIVHTHIKEITKLPTITKENSDELRQIADGAIRHIQALQALKRPTTHWDDLLVHILSSKLDAITLREWQASLIGTEPPTFKQFKEFITHRCQMLEATSKATDTSTKDGNKRTQNNAKRQAACVATIKSKCNFCNGEHPMYYCSNFLALPTSQRITEVRSRKICANCLRATTHASNKCTSRGCRICKLKHNTLLHVTLSNATESRDNAVDGQKASKDASPQTTLVTHAVSNECGEHVMLSTAIVHAFDSDGTARSCRVLLDSGSQANFVSEEFVSTLGIQPRSLNISISGINNTATKSTQAVQIKLQSRLSSYSTTIDCVVTDQITGRLPSFNMRRDTYNIPRNCKLADPNFYVSSKVDMLIGAELFWELVCVGQIKSSPEHPTLQKTQFGWILAGRLTTPSKSVPDVKSFHAIVTNAQLQDQLSQFWQLEDVGSAYDANYTAEEATCEAHFLDNVSQTTQGGFIVKLPVREASFVNLGDSREIAMKRLLSLERRLNRDSNLKAQYGNFLSEYRALNHMKRVEVPPNEDRKSCYLPHHCVFKNSGQSEKIRVVFDASCKTSSGVSLNDSLRVGPVVQQDLASIVIRFRTFTYVLTADIIKMYRQVLIHSSQTCLQRILWRDDDASKIETYELTTLTYGTSSASYLATRCLKHLADQHASRFPVGAAHVSRDFYVDDLLTGADNIQDAKRVRDEVIQVLSLGAFELSKWASNCPELLESVSNRKEDLVPIDDGSSSHILGIQWNQASDTFHFTYKSESSHGIVTKRIILSEISKLFNPLGLLGPIIVIAKLILQDLWRSGVHWDESVPQDVHSRWSRLKSQLTELNRLKISRCVKFQTDPQAIQLHGFCDASQQAFGACVYVRTKLSHNDYRIELLCSKSRIAPMKTISIPRLELSAAALLARLIEKIRASVDLANVQTYLWSDSTIAISWISSPSQNWSVFVANRVGEIQRLTESSEWRHVPSSQNPADLLSRDIGPRELIDSTLWWHGPEFLQADTDQWPSKYLPHPNEDMPEMRRVHANVATFDCNIIDGLLEKFSSLNKTCRILAYCLRCCKSRPRPSTLFVSHEETSAALFKMCKTIQQRSFAEEYKALEAGKSVHQSSRILSLTPFMDEQGLIRVGGRLRNSNLSFGTCHPILLPRDHELTKRIIMQEHVRNMHAGAQATMAAVRQQFWPLALRSVTRKIILNCVTCFKLKPIFSETTMSSLPAGRVTVSRPFSHCGIDYAGPITLRESRRRNARNYKAYIAMFVCFTTKAVHIEVVNDLTSDAFIGALKRFIARRDKPSHIHSDNGTNFVGAHNQLKELAKFLDEEQMQIDVRHFLCNQKVSWNFIPPNAPHHGGLWEAAVKSAKHHINRIVGKSHLTYEEMLTVLCEVEAILNSRPITPLSSDLNDLAYLSPGHFLVGTTMNGLPCNDLCDVNENRLIRWQRVEQLRQHFWRRWSSEYLHSLQLRSKWKADRGVQLEPNQIVLIKQQDLASLHWLLGRVQEVHPGKDGVVRTATVKTAKGCLTRPLSKLAILPIEATDVER